MTSPRRRCPSCEKRLAAAAFGRNSNNPDGYSTYCKACNNEIQRKWKAAHPDRVKRWSRNYRLRMRERNQAAP